MSDPFLDSLTRDLKPVKPLRAATLWAIGGVGLLLAAAFIWFGYGPRYELSMLVEGKGLVKGMAVGKPLLFLAVGLGALWAVAGLARPEGRLKMRYLLPLLVVFGVVLGSLMGDIARFGLVSLSDGLNGGMRVCYTTILVGGMIGLAALWGLWLRRAATAYPVLLGAMAGLAVSSLMAAAYAIHCNMDAPIYILGVYGVAVAAVTGVAALLGGKWLRW